MVEQVESVAVFEGGDLLKYLVKRDESIFVGKRFAGRYELERLLSVTGASVLLLARRCDFGGSCVIKLLVEDRPNTKLVRRFYREVRSLREIRHPSVVRLEDAGVECGVPYYVMEYLRGPTLHEYVRGRLERGEGYPEAEWLRGVVRTLAGALRHCHEFGVLHRDVKPENIIIEERSGLPVLFDFGLVTGNPLLGVDLEYLGERLTTQGEMLGTPAYQSPEQVDPGGDYGKVGPAADVWGLGAVLFYCLTGGTLYSEGTVLETYVALLTKEPRDVLELNGDVPRDLLDLVRRCLRKESVERPGLGEIEEFLSEEGDRGSGFLGLVGVMFGGVFSLLLSLMIFSGSGLGALEVEELEYEELTSSAELRVSGCVNRDDFRVSLGSGVIVGRGGLWDGVVSVEEGLNVIELEFESGGAVLRRKLVIERDTKKPRLVFEDQAEGLVRSRGGWIEGQVRDGHPWRLMIDGELVALSRGGRFEYFVGEDVGRRLLSYEAVDRVGNRVEGEVLVGGEDL